MILEGTILIFAKIFADLDHLFWCCNTLRSPWQSCQGLDKLELLTSRWRQGRGNALSATKADKGSADLKLSEVYPDGHPSVHGL